MRNIPDGEHGKHTPQLFIIPVKRALPFRSRALWYVLSLSPMVTFSTAFTQAPVTTTQIPQSLLKPATTGDVNAELAVAKLYYSGESGRRDYTKAVQWLLVAKDAGSLEAIGLLGQCYVDGTGVPKDTSTGLAMITSAADAGNPNAMQLLGEIFSQGVVVSRDFQRAVGLFKAAADKGNATAMDRLGVATLKGYGTARDPKQAFILFSAAAAQGDSWGLVHLGLFLRGGQSQSSNDSNSSMNSFSASTATASEVASVPPRKHIASKPDLQRALESFTAATGKGNRVGAYYAGQMLSSGELGSADVVAAMKYYRMSAARLYAPAQMELARLNEAGIGVPKNEKRAFFWYSRAADQGDLLAVALRDRLAQKMDPVDLQDAKRTYQPLEVTSSNNMHN